MFTLAFTLLLAAPQPASARAPLTSARAAQVVPIPEPTELEQGAALAHTLARSPEPIAPAPAVVLAVQEPPRGALVIASWYGPGFYGNKTACGQTYTPEIVGVAHKTLPCGTAVEITFRGTTVTVPVIDRGPYIDGRTLDLSNATRGSLHCTDLCTVRMHLP